MHHFASHSLKVQSLTQFSLFQKGKLVAKVARRILHQSTRTHYTRATVKRKMDLLEQENLTLREEVTAMNTKLDELADMKTKMEELTNLVKRLAVAQTPPPPPPIRTQAEATTSAIPDWTVCVETPTYSAPQHSTPWFPPLTAGEILRPIACEAQMPTFQHAAHVPQQVTMVPPTVVTFSAPAVHTTPQEEEPIFHSGSMGGMTGLKTYKKSMKRCIGK
jgi:hypothetical protein